MAESCRVVLEQLATIYCQLKFFHVDIILYYNLRLNENNQFYISAKTPGIASCHSQIREHPTSCVSIGARLPKLCEYMGQASLKR